MTSSHLTLLSVDVMLFQGYFFICVNNRNPHHGGQVFIKLVSSRLSSFYLLQISISTRVCESENRPSFLQILHISLCRQTHPSFQHAYLTNVIIKKIIWTELTSKIGNFGIHCRFFDPTDNFVIFRKFPNTIKNCGKYLQM